MVDLCEGFLFSVSWLMLLDVVWEGGGKDEFLFSVFLTELVLECEVWSVKYDLVCLCLQEGITSS